MSAINKRPPPDWDAEALAMWRKNASDVPTQFAAGDTGMMKKVRTYCNRFGYEVCKVADKIVGDEMFAAHFSKDPSRQGIHEAIAAKYLRGEKNIHDFCVLPKTGEGALYLKVDGSITDEQPSSAHDTKSLDFRWQTAGTVCYASHKYTRGQGGSQDGSFREQKQFLENFQKHANPQVAFFAICDGSRYGSAEMKELGLVARVTPPLSFASRIEDVGAALRKVASMTDNCKQ